MVAFDAALPGHRVMRQRVLKILLDVDKQCAGRHVSGPDGEFSIQRTVNRKGYRHLMPTFDDNDAARYREPRTRVSIVFEVPDDVTPDFAELVADLKEIDAVGLERAKKAKLEAARDRVRAAQAEVDRLEEELS